MADIAQLQKVYVLGIAEPAIHALVPLLTRYKHTEILVDSQEVILAHLTKRSCARAIQIMLMVPDELLDQVFDAAIDAVPSDLIFSTHRPHAGGIARILTTQNGVIAFGTFSGEFLKNAACGGVPHVFLFLDTTKIEVCV